MGADLGEDIVNAQNVITRSVVTAQNAIGQGVVEARNAMSTQHNALGGWLHDNLCVIYGAILRGNNIDDSPCDTFIGPLEEYQTFTPMVLNVLEQGQPTLMDKLNNIEHELIGKDDAGIVDAIKDEVLSKVDAIKDEVLGKVDAIEGKVDAIERKVEDMKDIIKS